MVLEIWYSGLGLLRKRGFLFWVLFQNRFDWWKQKPNPQRAKLDPRRANPRQTNSEQMTSKLKTTNLDRNHRNTRPTHRNPDCKPKITNPTTTKIGQPPPLKPKSQPTNQNLNPPTKILTHYTQIPKPTIDPQPLQSTAKKSRERVQERIKKKEEWEKKVIDFLGCGLMTMFLGLIWFNGFNFEFVCLGLIFWCIFMF